MCIMKKLSICLSIGLTVLSCRGHKVLRTDRAGTQALEQGIEGQAQMETGNMMPIRSTPIGTRHNISTIIYIYALASMADVVRDANGPFYTSINKPLIKTVRSEANGFFKASLPPGKYSLFTKENDLWFSNSFDQYNNICPVTVVSGRYTTGVNVLVNPNATY